jgi:hypothetical protein
MGENMVLKKLRSAVIWASVGLLPLVSGAQALTFKGVVSDSVNGMLIEGVMVSSGGASTMTDANGAFTLVITGTAVKKSLRGGLSMKGHTGDDPISVHTMTGASVDPEHLAAGRYAIELADREQHPALGKIAFAPGPVLTFSKENFNLLALTIPAGGETAIAAKLKSPYPLKNIFKLFLDPTIPEQGPGESKTTPDCGGNAEPDQNLIGGQLKRHNFIMVGEGYRRITLVLDGKVAWHYDTEDSWEDDEIWVLSNGNVLHAHMTYIEMISAKKEVIWRYNRTGNAEFHTCQPIGVDKVLFLSNEDAGAVVKLYNIKTKTFEIEHRMTEIAGGPHGQCRRLRMTPQGTYVFGILSQGAISEYDMDFKLIKKLNVGSLWGAVPLKNGNFLLQREGQMESVELNRNGQTVWSATIAELQGQINTLAPGNAAISSPQTCERLSNGNTVITTRFCQANLPQAIEVTPDKKVVWILKDLKNLGDAVSIQFLDEPGYPEIPGETNH